MPDTIRSATPAAGSRSRPRRWSIRAHPRWRSSACAIFAVAGVTACGASASTTDANVSTVPSTHDIAESTPGTPTTSPLSGTPSTPAATPSGQPGPDTTSADPAACLVGDWIVTEAELNAYYDTVTAQSAFDSIDVAGQVRITFTDSSFVWTDDYAMDLDALDMTYRAALAGNLTGTYETDGRLLAGTVDHDDRTGRFSHNGVVIEDAGDLFVGVAPARPLDTAPFVCAGPTLTIAAGPTGVAHHDITLTPA